MNSKKRNYDNKRKMNLKVKFTTKRTNGREEGIWKRK